MNRVLLSTSLLVACTSGPPTTVDVDALVTLEGNTAAAPRIDTASVSVEYVRLRPSSLCDSTLVHPYDDVFLAEGELIAITPSATQLSRANAPDGIYCGVDLAIDDGWKVAGTLTDGTPLAIEIPRSVFPDAFALRVLEPFATSLELAGEHATLIVSIDVDRWFSDIDFADTYRQGGVLRIDDSVNGYLLPELWTNLVIASSLRVE